MGCSLLGEVSHTENTEITEKLRQRFPSPRGGREGIFPLGEDLGEALEGLGVG